MSKGKSKQKQAEVRKPATQPEVTAGAGSAAGQSEHTTAGREQTARASGKPQRQKSIPQDAAGSRSLLIYGIVGFVLVALVGVGIWYALRASPSTETTDAAAETEDASAVATLRPVSADEIGAANSCRSNPRFATTHGLLDSINISTSERGIMGLVVYNTNMDPAQVRLGAEGVYQHETWDDAGYLGPVATDGQGNVFTAPMPRVSLTDNPPEKANIVYRIDSLTGVMRPLVDLPAAGEPHPSNAYGILGLTYDCDTNSLYVSSAMGSTFREEVGRVFHVDATTGEIKAMWEGIDALSLAVFNGASGKRLYYGTARLPEVRSIALDADGNFSGSPRTDLYLSEYGPGLDLRARRIAFAELGGNLAVRAVEFYFTLVAASEVRTANFNFNYDAATDTWMFAP